MATLIRSNSFIRAYQSISDHMYKTILQRTIMSNFTQRQVTHSLTHSLSHSQSLSQSSSEE